MRIWCLLCFLFAAISHGIAPENAQKRALPDAPKGYTPAEVTCPPQRPAVRAPNKLSNVEVLWLAKRRPNTILPMRDLLRRLNITGFNSDAYIDQHATNLRNLPNIGIAASGGGYRALLNGAGALAAFDARTRGSLEPGNVGGLLQSATYLSGLSGGGLLVGSIYANNFSSVQDLRDVGTEDSGIWRFGKSILEGPKTDKIGILRIPQYLNDIYDQVQGKRDAGFQASLTDYWGRSLAFQLVDATNGGPAHTWSSIASQPGFLNGDVPLPMLVANGRAPGEFIISFNATVFEMNPWEIGSYDPTLYGMAPLKYVGSKFVNGVVPRDQRCIGGFDNAGFIMGTSATVFNAILLAAYNLNVGSLLSSALKEVVQKLGSKNNDIADWSPNPFFGWNPTRNLAASSERLTLVDGGEDGENIPLYPHLQRDRQVDVVFAVDSSADTGNWPNGTSLIATYERYKNASIVNGASFPSIPDAFTFINLGLNARPTFFGCDSRNTTSMTPIIVYLPNHPYSYLSNISTFIGSVENPERNDIIQNGYNVATMGNATVDKDWPQCVGCVILARSLERTRTPIPEKCGACFAKHCWNGNLNPTPATFNPPYALNETMRKKSAAHATFIVPGHVRLLVLGLAQFVLASILL